MSDVETTGGFEDSSGRSQRAVAMHKISEAIQAVFCNPGSSQRVDLDFPHRRLSIFVTDHQDDAQAINVLLGHDQPPPLP